MFTSITIRRQNSFDTENPLDIGYLLECMLFYKTVSVIADPAILKQLLFTFGPEQLETLLASNALNIRYSENLFGIQTKTDKSRQYHLPVLVSSPNHSLQNELPNQTINLIGKTGKGRKAALRLQHYISIVNHDSDYMKSTESILLDTAFMESAIKVILRHLVPEFPQTTDIKLRTERTESGFVFDSNLNYEKLNQFYHLRVSSQHSSLTPGYFLALICGIESHLYFAASQFGELAIDSVGSDLIACRLSNLAERSKKSDLDRRAFAELLLDDAKALREAFNDGTISIDDIIPVILAASCFKDWLVKQNPDANLVREYYKEISKGTFIERLPGKSTRWVTIAGLGVASETVLPGGTGLAISVGLSALDFFFFDKLIKGWKPNQFIDEHLLPLVKKP